MFKAKPTKPANKTNKSNERARLQIQTREVLSREIGFMPNSVFREMDADRYWLPELQPEPAEASLPASNPVARVRMPAHLEQICAAPLLTAAEERDLFRRMNYLKYRANAIRSTLNASRPSRRKLDQIGQLLSRANQLRNHIVSANTRLVVSIAKRFAGDQNPFDDLLSEGISALMKAVEKFDFDRGFRFSTYATMTVRRELYRLIKRSHRDRSRYATGIKEVFEDQVEPEFSAARSESELRRLNHQMLELINRLDEREQFVVKARFGLIDLGIKPTYLNLGRELGVSKERVRQIYERAMNKMRELVRDLQRNDLEECLTPI